MDNPSKTAIAKAMRDPDHWVIRLRYRDRWGDETDRVVSPIRFEGQESILALCLGREAPRRFMLENVMSVSLVRSDQVLMPEPVTDATGDDACNPRSR